MFLPFRCIGPLEIHIKRKTTWEITPSLSSCKLHERGHVPKDDFFSNLLCVNRSFMSLSFLSMHHMV